MGFSPHANDAAAVGGGNSCLVVGIFGTSSLSSSVPLEEFFILTAEGIFLAGPERVLNPPQCCVGLDVENGLFLTIFFIRLFIVVFHVRQQPNF